MTSGTSLIETICSLRTQMSTLDDADIRHEKDQVMNEPWLQIQAGVSSASYIDVLSCCLHLMHSYGSLLVPGMN